MERVHKSVLVKEVIELLRPSAEGVYADMTFGEGGHVEALLDAGAGRVVAIDRDPIALERYRESGKMRADARLALFHSRMSDFKDVLIGTQLDGVVVDLGPSTRQLLQAERGFSFSNAGPIDMRMDQTAEGSLRERLSETNVDELAGFLRENADLHPAYRIAERLLAAHERNELKDTHDLAKVMGKRTGKTNPATTLFMALRMWVNEELPEVQVGLPQLVERLKPGGRLAVISFHSTEDRLVKRLFKELAGRCICDEFICRCRKPPIVDLILKKPLPPSPGELQENPRARSAKLRCVEKISIAI